MIVLFSDFGLTGPYLGQVKAVLYSNAANVPLIDLFSDAPAHNIRTNAYLLAAYASYFPEDTVFIAVVDPGVGTTQRQPVVVQSMGRWFVGPGNGLFDVIAKRDPACRQWEILWRPDRISASFHGRDLFAPIAAQLVKGLQPELRAVQFDGERLNSLPEELTEVIYIDHFGNLITGIRAVATSWNSGLRLQGVTIPRRETFGDVAPGHPLCYENANGLLEIAINQGRAVEHFAARVGTRLELVPAED